MKQSHILTAAISPFFLFTVFRAAVNAGPGKPAISWQVSVAEWLGAGFQGMSLFDVLLSAALIGMVVLIERLLRWLVWHRVKRRAEQEGRAPAAIFFLDALSAPFSVAFLAYGIYFSLWPVYGAFETPSGNAVLDACHGGARLIAYVTAVWFFVRLVALIDARLRQWAASTESTVDELLVPLVGKTLRVLIIVLGTVVLVQNMTGVKIGPVLASLGIGGIAVALAAKDSIANFFGTLTIVFDKPFQPGDRIVIDGNDGVVESVGFRSTRIRTLTGHLLTIPNEKIISSFVENISRRPHIRWLTNIGITYDTPPEKVEQAVAIIREVLAGHEGMREDFPPRVFFNNFNDWSLNIMVVAWYHPPDYWAFQAWVEGTCLEIMRRFEAERIDFAFPSRTIYVAGDDKRRLTLNVPKEAVPPKTAE